MSVSRRQLLRGVGACVALPVLPSLYTRQARATVPPEPQRLVQFFAPNGVPVPHWTPVDTGPAYTLSPALAPLAAVRDDVLVLSGLDNVPGEANHTFRTRSLFSERLPDGAYGPRFGATLDQVLAPTLAGTTRFPTLPLGSEPATACGTAQCAWLYNLSWQSETLPVTKDISPRSVFERMFGPAVVETDAGRARRERLDRSVLDAVLVDMHALEARLNPTDRALLDQYLSGVRSLERRLEAGPPTTASCEGGPPPPVSFDPDEAVLQMIELIVLALQCDLTRVVSYMIGAAESYRPLTFLGHNTDHHSASHNLPLAHLAATAWCVQRFATLVQRLADTPCPDGSRLLDHTFVLYASGLSSGTTHDPTNLPVLLGGRGGVQPPTGQHLALPAGTPFANLGVSLLRAYGVLAVRFGEQSTGSALDLGGAP
jgi:hypothetical protein